MAVLRREIILPLVLGGLLSRCISPQGEVASNVKTAFPALQMASKANCLFEPGEANRFCPSTLRKILLVDSAGLLDRGPFTRGF